MGSYVEEKEFERWYEAHKNDHEPRTIAIKKFFGVPFLWIKQAKYKKAYFLFNLIEIFSAIDYKQGVLNEK